MKTHDGCMLVERSGSLTYVTHLADIGKPQEDGSGLTTQACDHWTRFATITVQDLDSNTWLLQLLYSKYIVSTRYQILEQSLFEYKGNLITVLVSQIYGKYRSGFLSYITKRACSACKAIRSYTCDGHFWWWPAPTRPAHQKLLILEKRVYALGFASCCNTPSVVDLTIHTTAHLTFGVTETFAGGNRRVGSTRSSRQCTAGWGRYPHSGKIVSASRLETTGSTPCVSFNEHHDPSYSKVC